MKLKNIISISFIVFSSLFFEIKLAYSFWYDIDWQRRRQVVILEEDKKLDTNVAVAEIITGGLAREDGSDIVVTTKTLKNVLYRVVYCDPLDKTVIIFKADDKNSPYYIYYGNKNARPRPEKKWLSKRGLFLETRQKPEGNADNWQQMEQLIKTSPRVYGLGYVPNIFHGYNLFGPSDNYISIYKGYFYCPESGNYGFAVTSKDASFLFIDNEMVVQWPGWHHAVADARHNKEVKLVKGVHTIKYYHVEGSGWRQAAVCAWKRPSGNKYEVIPASAFLPLLRTAVGNTEGSYQQSIVPDFSIQKTDSILSDRFQLTRVKFKNNSVYPRGPKINWRWEFGDGTISNQEEPEHIYIGRNDFLVSLSAQAKGIKSRVFKRRLSINEPLGQIDKEELKTLKAEFAQSLKKYSFDRLSPDRLLQLMSFLEENKDYPTIVSVSQAYIKKDKGHWSRASLQARLLLVDAYFELEEYDKALIELKILEDKPLAQQGEIGIRLKLRIGDIYKSKGDFEAAQKTYLAASDIRKGLAVNPGDMNLRGYYAYRVSFYLKHGNLEEALDLLSQWENKDPLEKIRGQTSLFQAECYYKQGSYEKALRELTAIRQMNSESNFLPEIILLSGDCQSAMGNKKSAIRAYSEIVQEYPKSAASKTAAKKLKEK